MKKLRKIATTLSIASSVLMQSCTSSESTSALPAEANTKAVALNASWTSKCIITSAGNSTTTSASGGGGGTTGGTAYITSATFRADGSATLSTERFASTNCNANTSIDFSQFNTNYYIGNASVANDGSPVTNLRYSSNTSTTYTIFQIVNGINLYLGDLATSSAGRNGSSEAARFDGLGVKLNKI